MYRNTNYEKLCYERWYIFIGPVCEWKNICSWRSDCVLLPPECSYITEDNDDRAKSAVYGLWLAA